MPRATDVLYSLGIDITSLWSWGQASSDSRNTARDWLKWALYHLWSGCAWDSSYICKSSNKYASRDNSFSWTEKRSRSQTGRWFLPISKDSRRMSGSPSPCEKKSPANESWYSKMLPQRWIYDSNSNSF